MLAILRKLLNGNGNATQNERITLGALAEETGVAYDTLRKAAQDGRLNAVKSGHFWLSSPADVQRAIEEQRIRR